MKPSADFDLDTLKDEEGDRHGKQLRQGRNKGTMKIITYIDR